MEHIIHVLDKDTIDKIAAGEVVERPSSVVKELVENSIDAKASMITVEIKEGGLSLIRVSDNGEGIPKEMIKTAFLRHTTSKIKSAADLMNIKSLGFRGEALSSISAVSQVELLTKTPNELTGTRYVIEGSRETVFDSVGVPDGTAMIVRNLFYNTPARRKFLKTARTEGGYVSDYMERVVLSHKEIAFKFISDGKVKLQSYGNGKLLDTVYGIYGREVYENMLPLDVSDENISIKGYIGRPVLARSNRNYEIYYVNQRFIKSRLISSALDEAYKPYLMLHKFPFVIMNIDISPEMIDVNVHPSKMEIRFLNEEKLYGLLVSSITKRLSHMDLTVDIKGEEEKKPGIENVLPEPFEINRISREVLNAERFEEKITYPCSEPEKIKDQIKEQPYTLKTEEDTRSRDSRDSDKISFETESFISPGTKKSYRIIGQLFETYWLIESDNELYMIDQHAAHEKIKYERLMKAFNSRESYSQLLNPPQIITLTKREEDVAEKYMDHFRECGFELENFGGNEYRISAVPTDLYGLSVSEYFLDILDGLINDNKGAVDDVRHRIATMACKSAVKGNTKLTVMEADALIDELMKLENPYHCPHGRPTMIRFKKPEIEKMFKRIV